MKKIIELIKKLFKKKPPPTLEVFVADAVSVEEEKVVPEIGVGIFVSDTISSNDKPHQ